MSSKEVGAKDWVLMRGDEVIESSPDIEQIMKRYKDLVRDDSVYITKNMEGNCLFY
jgi:hypothetical protein